MFKTLCLITPEYMKACTSHHTTIIFKPLELGIVGLFFLIIPLIYTSIILLKHFIALWITKNNKNLMQDHYLFLICFIF